MNPQFQNLNGQLAEWQALQPLKQQDHDRLWRKLRLDWNYHSNHIEGNTLTYGETEILLVHGQVTGDHELREYVEMQAHDVAIEHLKMLVAENRPLSEADIRDFNRILLKEPFWNDAITSDGQASRIEILPGVYKQQPNNVRTPTGEIFRFADPNDVPIRMGELVAWLREALEDGKLHPIEIASRLHHEFVLIHPFGDGNGRTARILMNYVLMRKGYLPLIVPTEQKDRYLAALRKADTGDSNALVDYLAACAVHSMELGIQAAKGESIEEQDDLLKEIELLKRRQKGNPTEVLRKSNETLQNLYQTNLRPLLEDFCAAMSRLDDLFSEVLMEANAGSFPCGKWSQVLDEWFAKPSLFKRDDGYLKYVLRGYKGDAQKPFNISSEIKFYFKEYNYFIAIDGKPCPARLYGEFIPDSERRSLARSALEKAFASIKKQSGQE